jgi:hypothetical protein
MKRSKSFVTGLVIAALLAVGDITTPLTSDGEHPPMAVGVVAAVLGLITAVGIVQAWRGRGGRGWISAVIVTRLLSAMTAVPAFFACGVPAGAQIVAALGIAVTLVCVALLATRLRRPELAGAGA